jgi:prephenate dehydratase
MKVGYAGEPGAFGELAAERLFPKAERVALPRFADVPEAVARGEVEAGVLPVENSHAGVVGESYDLLGAGTVQVFAALVLPVRHCLLAKGGVRLEDVREVHSHPQALSQCARFVAEHRMRTVAEKDTATAARVIAEAARPDVAAIARREAAARLGLDVLAEDIQDAADNATRFFAFRRGGTLSGETTLVRFALDGGVEKLAEVFGSLGGVRVSHLQIRPSGRAFEPLYFAEIAAPPESLRPFAAVTRDFAVLGTLRSP